MNLGSAPQDLVARALWWIGSGVGLALKSGKNLHFWINPCPGLDIQFPEDLPIDARPIRHPEEGLIFKPKTA